MAPRRALILCWVLPLLCACGARGPAMPKGAHLAAGEMVRLVHVELDEQRLGADRSAAALRYDAPGRLERAVTEELRAAGRFSEAGAVTLDLTLQNLRLRSTFSALVLAWFAGADKLGARVHLDRGDAPGSDFETRVSSARRGLFGPAPEQRLQNLVDDLTRRIVTGL